MYLGCEIKRVGEVGFLYPEVYYFVLGALQRIEKREAQSGITQLCSVGN